MPLILICLLSFSFLSALIEFKTQARSICLTESLNIQKKLSEGESSLFALNPQALLLRETLLSLKLQLIAAVAAENYPEIVRLTIEINKTIKLQKFLDAQQKKIIIMTSSLLDLNTYQLLLKIQSNLNKSAFNWDFYLNIISHVKFMSKPIMAVKPDAPDLAPIYELKANYKQLQNLAYQWQFNVSTKQEAQTYIQSHNFFSFGCGSHSEYAGQKWQYKINVDKF